MIKYLIAESQEIDGHAYSGAYYIQVDGEPYTRNEKLNVIQAIASENGAMFQEKGAMKKSEEDNTFYGVLVFGLDDEDSYGFEEEVSYSFFKLPARMKKNTIYRSETRTG